MHECKICGNGENNETFEAKEMMFGYEDIFIYFQCSKCKCLQISEIPQDMSKYYPNNYYSYNINSARNGFCCLAMRLRDKYALLNKGVVGKLIYLRHPGDALLEQMKKFKLTKDSKILDVGSGNGAFLRRLKDAGFSDLTGIDLYIENEIQYDDKFKILKTDLHSISGKWDLILFIHSFEHMSDPLDVFQWIYKNLSDRGFCVIVIPITSSYAWVHYGTDWIQLDAPRHFFLHSIESIKLIAEKAKLDLVEINYVSDELQFWGSEQYSKGIPLLSEKSFEINPHESIFTFEQIAKFKQEARDLNASGKGDTAMFVLRKCTCNQVGRQ